MRVCFRSSLRPGPIEEYRRRHAAVCPEVLRALQDPGSADSFQHQKEQP